MTRDDSRGAFASYAHSLVPQSLAEAAPGLAFFLRYPRSYLRSDVVAGVTVGAVAVPSSMAMAELAGLPVRVRPVRNVSPACGLRAARDVAATRGRARLDAGGADCSDGGPDGHGRRRGRPGALCGARSSSGAGDGSAALPGRRAPAGVRRGLLRQAGAARLHQRRSADRDLVPARQAPRDQRRRGRLLRDRVGGLVEAGRCERADRAPERGAAVGGNRDSARPSCRTRRLSSCSRSHS